MKFLKLIVHSFFYTYWLFVCSAQEEQAGGKQIALKQLIFTLPLVLVTNKIFPTFYGMMCLQPNQTYGFGVATMYMRIPIICKVKAIYKQQNRVAGYTTLKSLHSNDPVLGTIMIMG